MTREQWLQRKIELKRQAVGRLADHCARIRPEVGEASPEDPLDDSGQNVEQPPADAVAFLVDPELLSKLPVLKRRDGVGDPLPVE